MTASAAGRETASALVKGNVIAVERNTEGLLKATRRKTGVIHATVINREAAPAGEYQRASRYVIRTDQGDTVTVPGHQTFTLVDAPAVPAVKAPAPADLVDDAPADPAELWRNYETAREFALAGDQDAPTRDDMKPRTETFRGRRLKVTRGTSWGTIDMTVNGAHAGSTTGNSAAAMNRAAEQLRKDVLAADERRVTDPDAYPAVWFDRATELPPAIVAYVRHRAVQDERDRAALAATTCTDPAHVPGVLGCPLSFLSCNGVPFAAHTITVHEITTRTGIGFNDGGEDLRRALVDQVPGVGTLSTGETPWDHKRVRRAGVWQIPVSGHLVTVVHYDARTPLTSESSYLAVLLDGRLIEGAGEINAAQRPAELSRLLAWTIVSALRTLDDAPAAVPAVEAPASVDQGDATPDDAPAASGPVEAPAVPTIDGVPAGMPYMVDAPAGWNVAPVDRTPKELAQILKRDVLSAWFPGVKFSVRTDKGSMYQGLHISWTDGPSSRAVDLVAEQWTGIYGKSDYRGTTLYVDAAGTVSTFGMPGVYVSVARDTSPAAIDAAELLPFLPAGDQVPAGWFDPFAREWQGGPRRDCARWLAGNGVDQWARVSLADGRNGCPVAACRLAAGHPVPGIHVNDYGRHFFATLPEQGNGDQGNGGEPVEPTPTTPPAPSFRTWGELAEHIAPGRFSDQVEAPAVASAAVEAPAAPRMFTVVVAVDGAGEWRLHKPGCRDVAGDSVGGYSEELTTPHVAGIVIDTYGDATREDWRDHADPRVMPCIRELPDVVDMPAESLAVAFTPAPARDLVIVNNNRGAIQVHKPGCRDIVRETSAGAVSWDVSSPDVRGIVVNLYGNGDFETFTPDSWEDWAGDVELMPCAGHVPWTAVDVTLTAAPAESVAAAPAPTVEGDDQGDQLPPAMVAEPAPAVRPELGDWVRVSGWSGVRAFVLSMQQDAVGAWETGETLRFGVDKVTEVTRSPLSEMRSVAAQVLESTARAVDIVEPARAILDTPTWESGAPKAGEGVRVAALNDTEGKRLDDVELLAKVVTKLGCGCWRIECDRPGLITAENMWKHTVNLRTGCHRHEVEVSVPLPTTEELDAARAAGAESYAIGVPAHVFPTSDEKIAPTFERLPVGSAVYSALITAYHEGYEQATAREVERQELAVSISDQDAVAAAVVAERNPAAQECADIAAAGAASARATLETRTAELSEAREIVAGDQGDTEQGDDEQPASWPEFYTLDVEDYTPQLDSDEGDEVVTITHNHEAGTTLDGSVRGDGVYEIAHAHGFTYRRNVGIFIQGSRDRFSRLTQLTKLGAALREAGHKVAFDIDDVWRPAAVREESRAERVSARVERLSTRAGRKFAEGAGRRKAAEAIGDRMPFGEPIKIGHHSERAHRRAFERIESNYRAAWAAYDYAEHLANRAEGADANEAAKHGPRAIMRRIERIETDKRKYERELAELMASDPENRSAYRRRLLLEIERIAEEVAYQRAKLGDKAASGEFVAWSKGDFVKGDFANIGGSWCKVIRANVKTVSVENRYGWGGDGTAPYDKVFGRRRDGMQWDAPNAEPWSVADAAKVAKWGDLTARTRRTHPGDGDGLTERANHGRALRLVLGMAKDSGTDEVEAYGEPADEAGKRARALAAWNVYERLTAGETFEQIAPTIEPLNDSTPRWVMPAGEPEEVKVTDLVVGDVVVGIYDMGFAGSRPRLIYSMVGPVTVAPVEYDRHESGEWASIEVDGTNHDVRAYRRALAHLVGPRS